MYQTPSFEVWKLRKAVFSLLRRMEARLPLEGLGGNERSGPGWFAGVWSVYR